MTVREFYQARAKELITELRESKEVSYEDLALKLRAYGVSMTTQALINHINRGTYRFWFAMMVLDALGAKVLELPQSPELHPGASAAERDGVALTKADLKRRAPHNPKP